MKVLASGALPAVATTKLMMKNYQQEKMMMKVLGAKMKRKLQVKKVVKMNLLKEKMMMMIPAAMKTTTRGRLDKFFEKSGMGLITQRGREKDLKSKVELTVKGKLR